MFAPWKKSYDQPTSILKSRDITLPTKVHLVKAVIFPVVMYGCDCWTINKAEHRRIDVFELWCWTRLLRVPWTARRSNQSILKEISPEYSYKAWSWSSNSLATWCKEMTHWKRPWFWEDWKQEDKWTTEDEMVEWHHLPNETWVCANSGSWWRTGRTDVLQYMGSQRVRHDWATELNWKGYLTTTLLCNQGLILLTTLDCKLLISKRSC